MASSIEVTVQLAADNNWEVIASVVAGGSLPADIFMYENNGTTTLGDYIGVCDLSEYQRLQTFTGSAIPKFGNRFVKYTQAKIKLGATDDPAVSVTHITNTVKALSLEFANAASTTQIIPIP